MCSCYNDGNLLHAYTIQETYCDFQIHFQMIYMLLLGFSLCWTLWTALCLERNYARARKLGVPIVFIPISTMDILWIVVQYPAIPIIERFLGSSNLTRYGARDWHFRDRAQAHIKFGDVWALVTPGEIWLNVGSGSRRNCRHISTSDAIPKAGGVVPTAQHVREERLNREFRGVETPQKDNFCALQRAYKQHCMDRKS
jgi:hypothetical protein